MVGRVGKQATVKQGIPWLKEFRKEPYTFSILDMGDGFLRATVIPVETIMDTPIPDLARDLGEETLKRLELLDRYEPMRKYIHAWVSRGQDQCDQAIPDSDDPDFWIMNNLFYLKMVDLVDGGTARLMGVWIDQQE